MIIRILTFNWTNISLSLSVRSSVSPQLYCSFQSYRPHLWKDCKVLIVIISLCVCVCGSGSIEPQNSLDSCQNVWWPHLVSDWTDVVSSAERLQSRMLMGKTWFLQRNEGERTTDTQNNLPTLCSSATKKKQKQIQVRQEEPAPELLQPPHVFKLCGFLCVYPTRCAVLDASYFRRYHGCCRSGTDRFYVCCVCII